MSNGAVAAGAAGATAAAAIARAIKASGAIVRLDPEEFSKIVQREEQPLIVMAEGYWGGFKYLVSHRGLVFFAKSKEPLELPSDAQIVTAQKIWIPS